jgi:hypothetical protein
MYQSNILRNHEKLKENLIMKYPRRPLLHRRKMEFKQSIAAMALLTEEVKKQEGADDTPSADLLKKIVALTTTLNQRSKLLLEELAEAIVEDTTNSPATPGVLSAIARIKLKNLADSSGITRQMLLHKFRKDRPAFEEVLFNEMGEKLKVDIAKEVMSSPSEKEIEKNIKAMREGIRTVKEIKADLTQDMEDRMEKIKRTK